MNRRITRSACGLVILAMGLLVLACQPQQSSAPAAPNLKVGIMVPLSGPGTRLGTNIDRFIRMGIEDVNKNGGIKVGNRSHPIEAVTVDSKFTSEGGRAAADRLVLSEKVRFLLGGLQQDTAGAVAVTVPNKTMVFGASLMDQSLGTDYPLNFLTGFSHTRMRVGALYQFLRSQQPQAKRVGLLTVDNAGGRYYLEVAEGSAKQFGFELVSKEFIPTDIKDLAPVVTRMLGQNLDGIDINLGGEGTIFLQFAKALNEQGWRKPMFSMSSDLAQMRAGAAVMQGFTTTVLADVKADVVGKSEQEVADRYVKQYGEGELEPMAIPTYNIPLVMTQAMEKAGTLEDTTKLAEILRGGEWDSVFGKTRFVGAKTFGLASVLEQPIYFTKVQGDKVVTFQRLTGTLP